MAAEQYDNSDLSDTPGFTDSKGTKGYELNRMCYSFNSEKNCKKFKAFPEAYCHLFNLNKNEIHAVTDLDIIRMVHAGGNLDYLSNLTAIYGLDLHDLGAQQLGLSLEEFKAKLQALSK